MSDQGFTVAATPIAAQRNRGYRAGSSGKPSVPPQEEKQRTAYLQGYRRGCEARERRSKEGA